MPRTLVVGLLREKEPHEMLDALGLDDAAAARRAAVRRQPARARSRGGRERRRVDLGFAPGAIDVVDDVRAAVGTAVLATPDDGQLVDHRDRSTWSAPLAASSLGS